MRNGSRSDFGPFLFMVIGILSWVFFSNFVFDNVWLAFLASGVGGGVIAWGCAEYVWRRDSRTDHDYPEQ